MKTLAQIIENLTDEQKQLLADTIRFGGWGDCEENFPGEEKAVGAYGYITDYAYKGNHFVRHSISNRFQNLFKALHLKGNKWCKSNSEMVWHYDWWDDGSGSILLIREELVDDFEKWAREYNQ